MSTLPNLSHYHEVTGMAATFFRNVEEIYHKICQKSWSQDFSDPAKFY